MKQYKAASITKYEAHLALTALNPTDKAKRQLTPTEVRCRYTPYCNFHFLYACISRVLNVLHSRVVNAIFRVPGELVVFLKLLMALLPATLL